MKKRRNVKAVVSLEKQAEQAILSFQKRIQTRIAEHVIIVNSSDIKKIKMLSLKRRNERDISKIRDIICTSGRQIDSCCNTMFKLDTALALIQRKINPA